MDRRSFVRTVGAAGAAAYASTILPGGALAAPVETKDERDRRLAWWREAKFGMFIHWGIYAVPALGEWVMNNLKWPERPYQGFVHGFNPKKYDPLAWVRMAKGAGMKYLVITSKHHDGFSMFDSKLTDYDVVDRTPWKRDVLKPLSEACAAEGIRFGFYYSILDAHWSGKPDFRKMEMKDSDFERYVVFMKGQLEELLTGYGPVGSVFFDGQWIKQWGVERGVDLEVHCRKFQPDVIINDRVGKQFESGDYNTPEQFIPDKLPERDWETCMTMALSWGYHALDRGWKSTSTLIRNIVNIASKGGNFLLNVGPMANGLIPGAEVTRLRHIGEWMKVNGEAIYGTEAGPLQNLAWGRSTKKPGKVFLHVFDWPAGGELLVPGGGLAVKSARLLAGSQELGIKSSGDNISIKLPERAPDPAATVIALEV